eukprot:TRINITY_DN1810_c0_g1_i1.p1 TRINITY_DN1810_c0_g1~~TRINITY_DN1810_c0_g1_i1.p1  ORF type:complete len:143 (-),score=22.52 TRINITY_DN1810_c0_g1_i1:71-457(-)
MSGLLRAGVTKVVFWSTIGLGFAWGSVQRARFDSVTLATFLQEEEKAREKLVQAKLDAKTNEFLELQKKLEAYEPKKPVAQASSQGKAFHIQDLEHDDLLDKWIGLVGESNELNFDDSLINLAVEENK